MFLQRTGWPEEGELVMCTVTKVTGNSVFCVLDEYGKKTGMIHISEVSPGRIRNLRDFVKEGKVVICKILKVDPERGYIDLSLRRVSESMRRNKADETKQEQKAEKIIEVVAKALNMPAKKFYDIIAPNIFKEYEFAYSAFEDVVLNKGSLSDLGIDKQYSDPLDEAIRQKIKPPEVSITGTFTLSTFASDGINVIKAALKPSEDAENVLVKYLGNGQYLIHITAPDYKTAEKILKPLIESAQDYLEKHEGTAIFTRKED